MGNKIQVCLRLDEETLNYLSRLQEDRCLNSRTKALELIVKEHKQDSIKHQSEDIAEQVVKAIEKKYGNAFTRIRLATRTADINSQVVLEILNSMLQSSMEPSTFVSTDTLKHSMLEKAEATVKARIAYFKQKNDDKKKGNKQ